MSPKFASAPLRRQFAASSLLVFAVLGFSGCAHTYHVKVDALSNPNATAGASYRIVPRDAVKADFEPQYAHAVGLIETALATKGYFPAESIRDAEMVIEVDFGIGSRRKHVTEDVGLFGGLPPPTASSRNSPTPGAQNISNPSSGLLAEPEPLPPPPTTRVTVVTLYEKFLSLSARETSAATHGLRKPAELWRVTVAVEDAKQTVEECLPVLVMTATDRLGTTTAARTSVRVSDKSPSAVFANNAP
jgi:hypothetical protein